MKIETIKKICKKTKTIMIYDRKWVSNGECMVAFPKSIQGDRYNIFELLSIGEAESEKYQIIEVENAPMFFNGEDYGDEEVIETLGIIVYYRSEELLPLTDGEKIYFIDVNYVKMMKLTNVRYSLRGGSVAVFDGLIFCGLINTVDMSASKLGAILSTMVEKMITNKYGEQEELE